MRIFLKYSVTSVFVLFFVFILIFYCLLYQYPLITSLWYDISILEGATLMYNFPLGG